MEDKKFLKGLFVKKREGSPDFVLGQISIKREDLITELQGLTDEWINLDILKEKEGTGIYSKINTWKPEKTEQNVPNTNVPYPPSVDDGDIPF